MTASPLIKTQTDALYEADYVAWVETTLKHLKQENYSRVDWENLLDEIEDMSRRERQALRSNLIVLLMHLLKWQHQPERRSGSWKGSIIEHRRRVNEAIKRSPSLKPYLEETLISAYDAALEQAVGEIGLLENRFSAQCPYEAAQFLERGFLPE